MARRTAARAVSLHAPRVHPLALHASRGAPIDVVGLDSWCAPARTLHAAEGAQGRLLAGVADRPVADEFPGILGSTLGEAILGCTGRLVLLSNMVHALLLVRYE